MYKTIGIILMMSVIIGCWELSTGERYGEIVKLSNKGVFFKTWEGEMILGGGSTNAADQTFCFSIDMSRKRNENINIIVAEILKAQKSGKRAKISYVQELMVMPWRAETGYMVQSVSVE